jgi:capsid protein
MMMGFITRQNPDDAFFPNATPQEATDSGGVAGSGEQGVAVAQLEAGTMTELEPGEDVKFSEPADVGGNYESFERIQLLRIAAGLGLPYDTRAPGRTISTRTRRYPGRQRTNCSPKSTASTTCSSARLRATGR